MSIDAIHIAQRAERAVLPLLTELLAPGEQENRIALGELYAGDEYIQVQLVAPAAPRSALDDDSVMGTSAGDIWRKPDGNAGQAGRRAGCAGFVWGGQNHRRQPERLGRC